MRERLDGNDVIRLGFLAFIEAFGFRARAQCEMSALNESP
jgi:hypothetical protein